MIRILLCSTEHHIINFFEKAIFRDFLQVKYINSFCLLTRYNEIISSFCPDIIIINFDIQNDIHFEKISNIVKYYCKIKFILLVPVINPNTTSLTSKYKNSLVIQSTNLSLSPHSELFSMIQKQIIADKTAEENYKYLFSEVRQTLIKELYNDTLLSTVSPNNKDFQKYFTFNDGLFQYGIIRFDNLKTQNCDENKSVQQIYNLFFKLLSGLCTDAEASFMGNKILFMINYRNGISESISKSFDLFLQSSIDILKERSLHITINLGIPVSNISELKESSDSAKKAQSSRLVLGLDKIISATNLNLIPTRLPKWPRLSFRSNMVSFFEQGNSDLAFKMIKTFLKENREVVLKFPYLFEGWFEELADTLIFDLADTGINENQIISNFSDFKSDLHACTSCRDSIICLFNFICKILELPKPDVDNNDYIKLSIAKEYIESHFEKPLQLEDVAKQVYLAPAYFGIFFKKETGINFSEYLFQIRMNKAIELLGDIRYNISEIANLVGYKDTHYFSKQFKKYTGVTPRDYRRNR